jgi:C-terminal processing protease CtpA/Prc
MKLNVIKNRCLYIVATLLVASTISCNRHKSDGDETVNNWILENMQIYYLWETHIPQKTDKSLHPSDYFQSLLYLPTDRFSWIQDNYQELLNSLSGVNTEAGYDYNLLRISNSDIIGYITYIKPGTPAQSAGLKRGDFFHKINDTKLTIENYSSLIGKTSEPHTLGVSVMSGNNITGVNNVQLSVISNYAENPILLDTIYNISSKNIGYFVYNLFARDNGDGSLAYEKELNNLFLKFKSANIDELIVDLRYNSGGAVVTAEALAAMISGQPTSKIFYRDEYNSVVGNELSRLYGPDYNKTYFINSIDKYNSSGAVTESTPINSLSGLSTVYFIVSGRSASASELLINGLKPYMNVVLIGDTTYGKNVGSISIYEENSKTNTWGMQPIVMKISNVDGFSDYGNGFSPNKSVLEYQANPIKPLGDRTEMVLQATINSIFGISDDMLPATDHIGSRASFAGSSIDRTPARLNQYISLKDMARKEKN